MNIKDFFKLRQDGNDTYIIPISESTAQVIAAASQSTAQKLIDSGKVKTFTTAENIEYIGLELDKRYGLLNEETLLFNNGLSKETLASYFDLRAELIETNGLTEEEIDKILSDPSKFADSLTSLQIQTAFNILKESQASADNDLKEVTGLMAARVNSSWDTSDTMKLPVAFTKELLTFLYNEKNQWDNEKKSKKTLSVVSTISDEVSN
jgi:hypothetical protein